MECTSLVWYCASFQVGVPLDAWHLIWWDMEKLCSFFCEWFSSIFMQFYNSVFMFEKWKKTEIGMKISSLSCISLSTKVDDEKTSLFPASSRQRRGRSPSWARGAFNYRRQGAVCSKISLWFFLTQWSLPWCDDGACEAESSWCCENHSRAHLSCFGKGIAGLQIASVLCWPCLSSLAGSIQLRAPVVQLCKCGPVILL